MSLLQGVGGWHGWGGVLKNKQGQTKNKGEGGQGGSKLRNLEQMYLLNVLIYRVAERVDLYLALSSNLTTI